MTPSTLLISVTALLIVVLVIGLTWALARDIWLTWRDYRKSRTSDDLIGLCFLSGLGVLVFSCEGAFLWLLWIVYKG